MARKLSSYDSKRGSEISVLRIMAIIGMTVWAACPYALPDTVKTLDGSVLKGTVTSLVAGKLVLKTDFAGEITIPLEKVATLETTEVMPVHLDDGA